MVGLVTDETKGPVFPDVQRHQGMRPVVFPKNKRHEEQEADNQHGDDMRGRPAVCWAESECMLVQAKKGGRGICNSRQCSCKDSNAENSQDRTQAVKGSEGSLCPRAQWRRFERLHAGHHPERRNGQDGPDNREEDEGGAPVKDVRGNTRRNAADGKAQRIASAEARERPVLATRRHGVGGAEDANGGRDSHGRGDSEDTAHNVHPKGVLREGNDEAAAAEARHAGDEEQPTAEQVGELAQGELESSGSETVDEISTRGLPMNKCSRN